MSTTEAKVASPQSEPSQSFPHDVLLETTKPAGGPDYGTTDHYLGDKGKQYLQEQQLKKPTGRAIDRRLRFQQFIRPTDTLLDFGCGSGITLHQLDARRKIGVEINPHARQHAAETYNLEVYDDAAEVEDGICDVIISNHCLEHVPYPIGALKELRKKLKPDGRLVLWLPADWRSRGYTKYNPNDRDMHLHTWTVQLLGNTLKSAGFEPERIEIRAHGSGWQRYVPKRLAAIRRPFFDAACWLWATGTGRRQVMAVARPK